MEEQTPLARSLQHANRRLTQENALIRQQLHNTVNDCHQLTNQLEIARRREIRLRKQSIEEIASLRDAQSRLRDKWYALRQLHREHRQESREQIRALRTTKARLLDKVRTLYQISRDLSRQLSYTEDTTDAAFALMDHVLHGSVAEHELLSHDEQSGAGGSVHHVVSEMDVSDGCTSEDDVDTFLEC